MKKFGLSKKERIKSKKEFDLVYSYGTTILSTSNYLKGKFYTKLVPESCGVKTAFAVSKKCGNAVWRNRVKRLLRGSYRLNKTPLVSVCREKNVLLLLVISQGSINQRSHKKITFHEIEPECIDLIEKIKSLL